MMKSIPISSQIEVGGGIGYNNPGGAFGVCTSNNGSGEEEHAGECINFLSVFKGEGVRTDSIGCKELGEEFTREPDSFISKTANLETFIHGGRVSITMKAPDVLC